MLTIVSLRLQPATDIRDCEGRLICKRSMFGSCMIRLLPQLQAEASVFWAASTAYTLAPGVVHSRGPHKFTICGHDRNNKTVWFGRHNYLAFYSLMCIAGACSESLACQEQYAHRSSLCTGRSLVSNTVGFLCCLTSALCLGFILQGYRNAISTLQLPRNCTKVPRMSSQHIRHLRHKADVRSVL